MLFHIGHIGLGLLHHVLLGQRNLHIVDADGDPCPGGILVTDILEPVGQDYRVFGTGIAIGEIDKFGQRFLFQSLVDYLKRYLFGQQLTYNDPAHGGIHHLTVPAHLDPGLQIDLAMIVSNPCLADIGKHLALARHIDPLPGHVVETENDILGRNDYRFAVGWRQNVVGRHHQYPGLDLGFYRERYVHRHLIAVEVGVKSRTDQRMQLDRFAFDEYRFKRLHAKTMQGRGAVEDNRIFSNHLVQYVPDLLDTFLHHLSGTLYGGHIATTLELVVDERFEQFQRHFLGQTALMESEIGADDNDRSAGIVDPLAKQILAETPLLALEHIGQRFQRPLVGTGNDTATAAVVKQHIHRFLEHALFVANNDIRRIELQQSLETVVPVYHPAVKIVEIGSRKAATLQRHQRPQIGRQDRDYLEDHPFGLIAGLDKSFDDL